jgi:hypothetical protein
MMFLTPHLTSAQCEKQQLYPRLVRVTILVARAYARRPASS